MDVTAERIFMSHSEDLHGRNYSRLGTWHPIHGFPYVLIDAFYVNSSFIVEDVKRTATVLFVFRVNLLGLLTTEDLAIFWLRQYQSFAG